MLFKANSNLLNSIRFLNFSKMKSSSFALMLKKFGEPVESLEKVDTTQEVMDQKLKDDQVLIHFMAAPINPADVSTVRGIYGVKPSLPSFIGNEGVAKVLQTGSLVNELKPGDWVIPALTGYGTWRTHAIASQSELYKIDNDLDLFSAAQLAVNPCTAYRMMKDFVKLQPGDCILQNGANSAVGIFVIQLARIWGFKTINVIRARPDQKDFDKLKSELIEHGADVVISDQNLRQKEIMNEIWSKGISKPKLAFDCIGGKNATDCISNLDENGVMVTYGGMSKQPLTIPIGAFIFKDLKFFSFWLTRWRNNKSNVNESLNMLQELSSLFKMNKLKSPKVIPIDLADFKQAFEFLKSEYSNGKVIFTMNK